MKNSISTIVFLFLYLSSFGQEFESIDLTNITIPADSRFGEALALYEDQAAIAAPGEELSGRFQGAVYLFTYDGTAWTETQKVMASNGSKFDFFGTAVDLAAGVLAVSTPFAGYFGSVYIFEKSGEEYTETAILHPEFPEMNYHKMDFGISVATNGESLAVGAPGFQANDSITNGAVFIFQKNNGNWKFSQLIKPALNPSFAQFGYCLEMTVDQLIVGAPGMDSEVTSSGKAFIYMHTGEEWVLTGELVSSDPQTNAQFGASVGMDGNQAIVGIKSHQQDGMGAVGAAEIFNKESNDWQSEALFSAHDGQNADFFGHEVRIDNDLAAVSSLRADTDTAKDIGALYIFVKETGVWLESRKYQIDDVSQSHANLGNAIDLNEHHLLVGSHLENNMVKDNGGAYYVSLDNLVGINVPLIDESIILEIAPNPFYDQLLLNFSMKQSTHVRIDIFDLFGKHVKQLYHQYSPMGSNQILSWHPDASIEAGVYLVRILVEGRQFALKCIYFNR